jgi:RNA 3'-terminal phosphate cyclase
MKKLALTAIAALTLTACATGNDAYYNAIAEREKRQAEQELRADTAIAQMAQTGDPQAKGMAIMYFATKNASRASQSAIAAPKSVAEQVLPWASLFVPALTQIYHIGKTTEVQLNNSDNALAAQQSNNQLIQNIVVDPIIGTQDDVLLFPR